MSEMVRDKRATRGQRMSALVGDALDEDNAFYGAEIWEDGDDSDAASFSEEEVKPDEFDSDFNDTEDEGEAVVEGENSAKGRRMARDLEKSDRTALKNVYKEPTHFKRPSGAGSAVKRERPIAPQGPIDRTVRGSTKAKTEMGEKERAMAEKMRARIQKPKPIIKTKFTQKELLNDGLITEEENVKWLLQQKFLIDEKRQIDRSEDGNMSRSLKRWQSKRGMNNLITFTAVDAMPAVLKLSPVNDAPKVPKKNCIVTGKLAKYRDPLTGALYADINAFKEIRRRHKLGLSLSTTGRSSSSGAMKVQTKKIFKSSTGGYKPLRDGENPYKAHYTNTSPRVQSAVAQSSVPTANSSSSQSILSQSNVASSEPLPAPFVTTAPPPSASTSVPVSIPVCAPPPPIISSHSSTAMDTSK